MIVLALPWWAIVLSVVVAILGAARLTRLVTHDAFPPAAWLRMKYDQLTDDGDWSLLAHCPWCFGPWAFALAIGTWFPGLWWEWAAWVWWIFWSWLAGSYLVSQYVHFDEGNSE